MEYIVRKGYRVMDFSRNYEAGEKIPASSLERIKKEQGWKIDLLEPIEGKKLKKEKVEKEVKYSKNESMVKDQIITK
jgi:hypothetical protein